MAENSGNTIDIKSIILRFWHFKWLFLFSLVVFLTVAYFHNKFAPTVYKNSIQISVDIQENRTGAGRHERIQAVNFLTESSNLENELGKMNSFPFIKTALMKLEYEVSYHIMESPFQNKSLQKLPYLVSRELYKESPIKVSFYRSHNQLINTEIFVTILTDTTYRLKAVAEEASTYNYIDNEIKEQVKKYNVNKVYKFGEEVESDYFKFYLSLKDTGDVYKYYNNEGLYFMFHHMDYLTLYYLNNIEIEPTSPTSSLIDITLTGNNHHKVTEFLNQLAQVYIARDLEEKNREARSTIEFIESQISDVASSLSYTGYTLERFRSLHKIVDLDFQGQMMYEKLNDLENERATMLMQKKFYEQFRDYIKSNKVSELMAPSSMNISDPILSSLIAQLIELNAERTSYDNRRKSVYMEELNNRFDNLKKTILENINTNLINFEISLDDIDYRITKISNDLSILPSTELKLQSIQRKFKLNDEIYTYLLTKRAEAQIAQASNFPSYEIIDPARDIDFTLVFPRTRLNYFLALFIGFIIPGSSILLLDFFNIRIKSVSDIENITNIPIIGNIAHSRRNVDHVGLNEISYSTTSESIRMLRTNIQMLQGSDEMINQVILVTSSTSSEGKTFSSINLAKGFSLLDKKVILVGCDLRKPKLAQIINLPEEAGLSSYISNDHEINDIIYYTDNYNLDIIPEGPLPPNPTELIASQKTIGLIEYLRTNYDYVIIDTSPVGIVPDSKLIMKYTDINLLLVRQTKTKKNELMNTLKSLTSVQVSKFFIVFNDFTPKNGQYNYMYKYYANELFVRP